MKATIENPVIYLPGNKDNWEDVKSEYFMILQSITTSDTFYGLRIQMSRLFGMRYFKYGFGTNHMWVHQVSENQTLKPRLIFVENNPS
jgi:hypothetical protein